MRWAKTSSMRNKIHSFYIQAGDLNIAFLRIAKYFAWHTGDAGDWITVTDDPITDEMQKETMLILSDQAAMVLKLTPVQKECLKIGIKSFYDRPRNT